MSTSVSEFLKVFFPDENETIFVRGIPPREVERNDSNYAIKGEITRHLLATDKKTQCKLIEWNKTRGIYFIPNAGGHDDAEIKRYNAWFAESDDKPLQEQYAMLWHCPLQPSILVETKKSVHAYWLVDGTCDEDDWRDIQERLIAYFNADPKIKNPSRLMRLPYFFHLSSNGEKIRVEVADFSPENKYTVEQMKEAFPQVKGENQKESFAPSTNQLDTWDRLNNELRSRMLSHSTCRIRGEWAHLKGVCHNGHGLTALALNIATGAFSCQKGCTTGQILQAFGLPEMPQEPISRSAEISESKEVATTPKTKAHKAIVQPIELKDALEEMYVKGVSKGVSTGWKNVDELYTVKKGQWTILSGMPSMGKSSWLDALLVNLAFFHGWRFGICSPESQPLEEHAKNLIELFNGLPFWQNYRTPRMTKQDMFAGLDWLNEHFTFLLPDEADCTINGILSLFDEADEIHKGTDNPRPLDGVIIDPWNELEHRRPSAMTETEYTSHALSRMRRWARLNSKHLWLVAHPRKINKDPNGKYPMPTLYDINGSANFRNKADMGVVIWRDIDVPGSPTTVQVQKVRKRWHGKVGQTELWFDMASGRFTETPINMIYSQEEEAEMLSRM